MNILVVDDHAVVRAGIAAVLGGMGDVVPVEASSLADALAAAAAHDLDLVLLDLRLPGVDGMAALATLAAAHPALPIVILSASEAVDDVRRTLAAGALGYLPKSSSPATLISALRLVLGGGVYVPPFVVGLAGPPPALTARQAEVLALIVDGCANKEIAYRLALSQKTVKAHVTAILRALGVATRAEAAARVKAT